MAIARVDSISFLRRYVGGKRLRAFAGNGPLLWGWKDPRTTATWPLWKEVFPRARAITVHRNGVDVAASLWRRARNELTGKDRRRFLTDPHLNRFASPRCLHLIRAFQLWEGYPRLEPPGERDRRVRPQLRGPARLPPREARGDRCFPGNRGRRRHRPCRRPGEAAGTLSFPRRWGTARLLPAGARAAVDASARLRPYRGDGLAPAPVTRPPVSTFAWGRSSTAFHGSGALRPPTRGARLGLPMPLPIFDLSRGILRPAGDRRSSAPPRAVRSRWCRCSARRPRVLRRDRRCR